MGMRLLPTDWTAKCESVENQYRVWVLDYEQALHSTSCLPVHPSIRRKRGESNGCSFSVRWRVVSVREGGGRRPVTVRDSKLYHKQVVLGHCPFLPPPPLPPSFYHCSPSPLSFCHLSLYHSMWQFRILWRSHQPTAYREVLQKHWLCRTSL